jgi:hypothetical protein
MVTLLLSGHLALTAENNQSLPTSIYAGSWESGHLQGMAIDDNRQNMYFSFTSMLVKTDMSGKVIGTVTGITGHLGDLDFYQGKVYGSLEFKEKDSFYIAVFDVAKISAMNIPYNEGEVMKTVYLPEVVKDYKDNVAASGVSGEQEKIKHRYGCSGIDGVTFGTIPGSHSHDLKLMVAYGIYGENERKDNDYQIILQYDRKDFTAEFQQVLDKSHMSKSGVTIEGGVKTILPR